MKVEVDMRSVRSVLCTMLGYSIERLDEYDDNGLPVLIRFEARCPHTGSVITSSATLRAARQCIIARELNAASIARNDDAQDNRHAA
jgi:hypothetical protein